MVRISNSKPASSFYIFKRDCLDKEKLENKVNKYYRTLQKLSDLFQ